MSNVKISGPCFVITPEIIKLSDKLQGESPASTLNLFELWYQEKKEEAEKNGLPIPSIEEYPSAKELSAFKTKLRKPKSGVFMYEGEWSREEVSEMSDKVFLFGDNTEDRVNTHHIPTKTQAVIRDLPNAIGIDTKKNRGTDESSYFTDADFDVFKAQVDDAINKAILSGKPIVLPKEGIGTGKAMLQTKAPKLFNYLQNELNKLVDNTRKEAAEMLDEAFTSSFETPQVTTLEQQEEVDLDFDPRTRRDRVTLIARFFSNEVDTAFEEIKDSLMNSIDNAESIDEAYQLKKELEELDRYETIKKYTPAGIFERVLNNVFKSYVADTEENRIQEELNKINSMKGSEKYSDDQKLEAARKKAAYKYQAYQKVIKNFQALAEEASTILIMTEGVRIDLNYLAPKNANLNNDTPEGESELDNTSDEFSKEEVFKDGWMTNFRQVSSQESLSQAVRKVIREVPKLDYKGKYEKDDLGFTRYLDADYVHAVLIDKLRNMISADDMLPMLEELQKNKLWIKQISKLLVNDESLFSQFYQDFRKDFVPYWIQKKKIMPDGTFKMETIAINKPEGVYYLLDAWRDNYENGIQLDDDSVYEKNGDINRENAAKGLKWVETLNNMFNNKSTEERLALLEQDNVWKTILKLLNMLGIDANPAVLKNALTDIKTSETIKYTDPIMLLLPQLNIIFSGVSKGEVKSETKEDGIEKKGDLINTFGSAYNMIASMIANVTEDAIESSVRENDKSYYSHVTPSYLGKLIKQLKDVRGDSKKFEEFINTEFKQYEWFFKDGRWRSDWIEQLATNEVMRKGLNHKVVLNSDKVDYSNWDDLDYTLALLTEYWGDPEDNRTSIKWAWYHVPILSDAPSAEFIRFRKYVSGVEFDEDGNKMTYDDIITEKLIDLLNQEYDRIMLVLERDEAYQRGDSNVEPIANYDIIRNSNGTIESVGGSEFKFLPALNNLVITNTEQRDIDQKIAFLTKHGKINDEGVNEELERFKRHIEKSNSFEETFINKLARLREFGTGVELKEFLKESIHKIMDEGFEETFKDWYKVGLLEELPNGKYKNIPFAGQSKQNAIVAKALNKANTMLGSEWTPLMEEVLTAYSNNTPIEDTKSILVFDTIKEILNAKLLNGAISKIEYDSITRSLFLKNNAKAALREYYWNSKLATSQIIEMTTTDLAFYKSMEDFQKRYKEVHAPALRMNTKATYKGQRIGREWERTIYIQDEEIVSTVLEEVKSVLDDRVAKNEMTELDRDFILSKFEEVNVADAQAYRSLDSYRSILGMSGQWTDEMETAYNNFKSGKWSIADFNIIWQTKKPYVYTQVNNISGVGGHTGIKTPVQHKNSEFLLLAMHELVAGPLGKSSKLKAINEFMQRNNIDVVQFESTTKVGKQGIINLRYKNNAVIDGKSYTFDEYSKIVDSKLKKKEISKKEAEDILKPFEIVTQQEVIDKLSQDTGIADRVASKNIKEMNLIENPNVVHKISYEDYGIQTATPEHIIETFQLVGTQIRKLITADISEDTIINVPELLESFKNLGQDYVLPVINITVAELMERGGLTKSEWLDLYNAINTENIIQAFSNVNAIFKNPKEVEKALLEEIRGNQRYGVDMIRACTLNDKGQFNIPLFDPIQSQRVQTLLNSIIKSRITKQKIRGGALIQVSDYGLTDKLNIVFKDKDNNLLSWEIYKKSHKDATKDGYNKVVEKAKADGSLSIAYLECYMPAYSRKFYEPLMTPGTHELDISKLPDDLRRAIGYRVPTEDKYSMAPLYIKGFLPQQNGSAIMLPSEITTLSGSDFDVDKMYIMLPEFKLNTIYNIKKAWDDFYQDPANQDIVEEIDINYGAVLQQFIKEQTEDWEEDLSLEDIQDFEEEFKEWMGKEGIKKYKFSTTAQDRFSKWFKGKKNNYFIKQTINKVKYDFSKKPQEQSLKARNNLLIDMMYGVLTNSDTASKILNPGGFDYQKKAARIVTILDSNYEKDLRKELNLPTGSIFHKLASMSLKELTKIAERTKKQFDPLSPRTQVLFHQMNMVGGKMIGIYANHNANHALMQHTNLALSDEYGAFYLNGKKLTSLHSIMNNDKEFISRNTSGWLAGSVDNVKDNTLAPLNQNTLTADASMLLSRLGYNPVEIGLLMRQPIIMDITQEYFRESRNGKNKDAIIDDILLKYQKKAAMMEEITYDNYSKEMFYADELANNILISKEMVGITSSKQTSDGDKVAFYKKQVAVGFLFKRIMKTADALGTLVQATRADTQNGAAGPTIADTMLKIQKVRDFIDSTAEESSPLINADIIFDDTMIPEEGDFFDKEETLRNNLLSSPLPFLQAFYSLGIKETEEMLSRYFPQYTNSFNQVIEDLRSMTKTGRLNVKTMNSIYNDLLVYIMSNNEFFGTEPDWSEVNESGVPTKLTSSENKRKSFINYFPDYFKKIVAENKDIADLEFIKRLRIIRANDNNPVDTVVFKNVGQLSPTLRERYMRDWASLLYMRNPKAQQFALNLFRYSYYRNGFAFGPSTFIHLAPLAIRTAIPGYISSLRSLLLTEDDYSQFVDQYIYNHLDNRKLVPEIPEDSTVLFIADNKIKDTVTFVIDKISNYSDKKVIRERIDTVDGPVYDFFKYIARRNRGNYVYYRLSNEDSNVATYTRIEPLGSRNSFLEYEYGKDVTEMKSVIKKNSKDYNPNNLDSRLISFDTPQADINDEQIDYLSSAYSESALTQAAKEMGYIMDTPKGTPSDDIASMQPNIEYKDANDEKPCGFDKLPTLYSL